jgi:hypothetical protein
MIDMQGHIVSNNHVVDDAKIVDITFTNGDRAREDVETQNNSLHQGC